MSVSTPSGYIRRERQCHAGLSTTASMRFGGNVKRFSMRDETRPMRLKLPLLRLFACSEGAAPRGWRCATIGRQVGPEHPCNLGATGSFPKPQSRTKCRCDSLFHASTHAGCHSAQLFNRSHDASSSTLAARHDNTLAGLPAHLSLPVLKYRPHMCKRHMSCASFFVHMYVPAYRTFMTSPPLAKQPAEAS